MPQGEALEAHKQTFSPQCSTAPCLQQGMLILYIVPLLQNGGKADCCALRLPIFLNDH